MSFKKEFKVFNFGLYLKTARIKAGLSQVQVAKALGHGNSQSICDWERNHGSTVPAKSLVRLLAMYNLSTEQAYEALVKYELSRTRQELEKKVLPILNQKLQIKKG